MDKKNQMQKNCEEKADAFNLIGSKIMMEVLQENSRANFKLVGDLISVRSSFSALKKMAAIQTLYTVSIQNTIIATICHKVLISLVGHLICKLQKWMFYEKTLQ